MGFAFSNAGAMATGFNPLTPAMPSFNAGELLLIGTGVRANGETLSAPAGWTLLTPGSNAQNVKVFGRIAQPGDTAPTIDWSASSQAFAQIACFNGDVPSSLTGAVAFQVDQAGTDTALQYPRLTMGAAKTLVIAIGKKSKTATSDGTTADPLTGFTQIGSSANSGNNVCSYWGYQIQDTCQNVLAATQTFSGTAESAAYQTSLIALLSQLPDITPDYAGVIARVQGYR